MNEKLKKALQLALKNKGLNEGLAEKFIVVEKEEDIEGAINDFVALQPTTIDLNNPEIVKALDQARTQAVKTNTANLAKKYGFDPNTPEPPTPATPPTPPADETPREKALREKLELMEKKLDTFTVGQTTAQKQAAAAALLTGSKVLPDNLKKAWLSRFNLESETPFEEQLKAFEDEHTETEQNLKNSFGYAGKPQTGFSTDKPSNDELDAVIGI